LKKKLFLKRFFGEMTLFKESGNLFRSGEPSLKGVIFLERKILKKKEEKKSDELFKEVA